MTDDITLGSAVRTPIGSFNAMLASVPAARLGSLVVAEAIRQAGIEPGQVDKEYMGIRSGRLRALRLGGGEVIALSVERGYEFVLQGSEKRACMFSNPMNHHCQ